MIPILICLCISCRLGSVYPYPVWGSPYESADHFWPMYNITDGILEDVEGAAHTMVYNGGKIVQVPQLEHALFLDGVDDYVDTGKYRILSWTLLLTYTPKGSPSSLHTQHNKATSRSFEILRRQGHAVFTDSV